MTRATAVCFLLLSVLPLSACDDSVTVPEPERLNLDQSEVILDQLGQSTELTAGGERVQGARIEIRTEIRWLHDRPVLDTAALQNGTVTALSPGRVQLAVTHPSRGSDSLAVIVRPARPMLLAVQSGASVGSGDTVTVRGYRVHELDPASLRVGQAAARVTAVDSANLRFMLPSLVPTTCGAEIHPDTIVVTGADIPAPLTVQRRVKGELRLLPGEAVRLSAGQASCLRLSANGAAEYALAYLDTRAIQKSQSGFEGYYGVFSTYQVGVRPAGVSAQAVLRDATSPLAIQDLTVHEAPLLLGEGTSSSSPFTSEMTQRNEPWVVGDRFAARDYRKGQLKTARVHRVYGDYLVVAVVEEDWNDKVPQHLAGIDSAMSAFLTNGMSMLQEILPITGRPTTNASGQLLMLFAKDGIASSWGTTSGGNSQIHDLILWGTDCVVGDMPGYLAGLVHEMGHAFQRRYMWEHRPAGQQGLTRGALWATEGGARLLEQEMMRRRSGIEPDANWNWLEGYAFTHPYPTQQYLLRYASEARIPGREFTLGYSHAVGFLRDLAFRWMQATGSSYAAALREIAVGALEGWHGYDLREGVHRGLTERMRSALDPQWTPEEGLLTWVLSQALDDLTGSTVFQNRAFRRVSTATQSSWDDSMAGWKPRAQLRHDSATGISITAPYGSPDYIELRTSGTASFVLSSTVEGIEWMVARIQ